ncbi:hypothetical protein BDP55DRAFT_628537 [Colletotrichum godetiae]|uniref:Uncharacterized protein n=1 Tax=Colletotrichum godetiae TaxID=1209918 RepID=A0AAJ0F1Z5_9PEZI|nr:uncharacterized protein BDP55DRAFT_628537 [Colletotrichum godetiae]KAK1690013.1 hypothetical protein BDP55DRAFT_628537 [Colletotrichum godetiae]
MNEPPQPTEGEGSPSWGRLRTVRRARNSPHDVPCGEECLVYPQVKKDHTPTGIMGKVARYLELDLESRPWRDDVWMERKGRKRRHGGRHRRCLRPNQFHPGEGGIVEEEETMEGELVEPVAREPGGGEQGRVYPTAAPVCGEERPANRVAAAWGDCNNPAAGAATEEAIWVPLSPGEVRPRLLGAAEVPRDEGADVPRDWRRGSRRVATSGQWE